VSDFKRDINKHEILQRLRANNIIGFFYCEVTTPLNLNIPVLPVHYQGKLTFPLGTFTGH